MKGFIITLITIFLFALHLIPAIIISQYNGDGRWGIMYLALAVLDTLWGSFLYEKWDNL